MFDLSQFGMPALVEAHGSRWIAVYHVSTTDEHQLYLAVPAAEGENKSLPLPLSCSLILVPLSAKALEGVRKRKEREAK